MSIDTVEMTPSLQKEIESKKRNVGYAVQAPENGAQARARICEDDGGHVVEMRKGEWPLRKKSPTRPPSGAGICLCCGVNVTAQEHTPAGVMRVVVPAKRGVA